MSDVKGEHKLFSDVNEVLIAYEQDTLNINARIRTVVNDKVDHYNCWKGNLKIYCVLIMYL